MRPSCPARASVETWVWMRGGNETGGREREERERSQGVERESERKISIPKLIIENVTRTASQLMVACIAVEHNTPNITVQPCS